MAEDLKTIIGLEVHVQLDTKSKMFCTCDNFSDDAGVNQNVCPICLGHPGVLPVPNKQAVEWTILTGLAIGCEIPSFSKFDRKQYFYPDLPKGYQISQYDEPFCVGGEVSVVTEDGNEKVVRLDRIHLEEDAAKNTHPGSGTVGFSLVDFNRAGTPLMEIVSKPDLETPEQARVYMQELQQLLRYLGVSRADMEKGHMRCDANISIENAAGESSGIVEVKNMNSTRAVERSLEYEQERLRELMRSGAERPKGKVTRGWDDGRGETFVMREKEAAADYRYFPEPDIPPFTFSDDDVDAVRRRLPELPKAKRARFEEEYGLSAYDAEVLTENRDRAEYFEQVVSEAMEWASTKSYDEKKQKKLLKMATNYVLSELLRHLKEREMTIGEMKKQVTPENFAELMVMTLEGEINSSATQKVLDLMIERGGDPSEIVDNENLRQMNDDSAVEAAVDAVIAEHAGPAKEFADGKDNTLQFLIGMVMKATGGKANPGAAKEMFEKKLRG